MFCVWNLVCAKWKKWFCFEFWRILYVVSYQILEEVVGLWVVFEIGKLSQISSPLHFFRRTFPTLHSQVFFLLFFPITPFYHFCLRFYHIASFFFIVAPLLCFLFSCNSLVYCVVESSSFAPFFLLGKCWWIFL